LSEYRLVERPPLEAQLIDFVDEIAYNTADLDDGYEAKLLDIEMIRPKCRSSPNCTEKWNGTTAGTGKVENLTKALKNILDRSRRT